MLWKRGGDGLVYLMDEVVDLIGTHPVGKDRGVDGEFEVARIHLELAPRHRFVSPFDGERNDGKSQLQRYLEPTALEVTHASALCASSFGEDDDGGATLKVLFRLLHCLLDGGWLFVIHENLTRNRPSASNKGHVAKSLFHDPTKGVVQESVDEEDVEGALVVSHKDVGLLGVDIFASTHRDAMKREEAGESPPNAPRVVPPEAGAEEPRTKDCYKGKEECCHQKEGSREEQLEGE